MVRIVNLSGQLTGRIPECNGCDSPVEENGMESQYRYSSEKFIASGDGGRRPISQ